MTLSEFIVHQHTSTFSEEIALYRPKASFYCDTAKPKERETHRVNRWRTTGNTKELNELERCQAWSWTSDLHVTVSGHISDTESRAPFKSIHPDDHGNTIVRDRPPISGSVVLLYGHHSYISTCICLLSRNGSSPILGHFLTG